MTKEMIALRLAVRVLQVGAITSRCWSTRTMNSLALRVIGKTGALPVTADGEVPQDIMLAPGERPDQNSHDVGNYQNMWGP